MLMRICGSRLIGVFLFGVVLFFSLSCCLSGFGSSGSLGYDWPMFRNSASNCGFTLVDGPGEVVEAVWRSGTGGEILSSPVVSLGRVFIGCRDGWIYCFNVSSGERLWNAKLGEIIAYSSPAVSGNFVFIGDDDGNVVCLDVFDGEKVWVTQLNNSVKSSPTVVGDRIFVGSWDDSVYCLDAGGGEVLWVFETGGRVDSSPAVVDGVVYVGCDDSYVYALDAFSGLEVWRFKTGDRVFSSPSVWEGLVFVGSDDGYVYCLDAFSGDLVWRFRTDNSVWSSPAVVDGVVFVGSNDNHLYCLDAFTGEKIWSVRTGFWVSSSPAVAGNYVYVGSEDGNLYCFDVKTGVEIWSYPTLDAVISSPAVADGKVFFASSFFYVYALGDPEGIDFVPVQERSVQEGLVIFNFLAVLVAALIVLSIVRYIRANNRENSEQKTKLEFNQEPRGLGDRFRGWIFSHKDAVCLLGILGFCVIFFVNLSQGPLWRFDEQTYSQMAYNMVNKGNFLRPWAFGGQAIWIGKPPLMMWLMSISYQIFGVTNFSSRIWSPIFATLSCVVVFYLGKMLYSRFVGLLSVVVLGSFSTFFVFSKLAMTDVPFVFFMMSSLYFLLLTEKNNKINSDWFAVLAGLFFGLALMTRQVAAFLVPLIFFAYMLITKKSIRVLFSKHFGLFLLCGFLVFGPWLVYMNFAYGGEFWYWYFMYHGVMRSVTTIEGHMGGYFYYFEYLYTQENLLWMIALPFALGLSVFKAVFKFSKQDLFVLVWIALVLLVFTVAQTKLYWYILPVFPAFALVIARFFEFILSKVTGKKHNRLDHKT